MSEVQSRAATPDFWLQLGLSARTAGILFDNRVQSVKHIRELGEDSIRLMPGLGQKAYSEICGLVGWKVKTRGQK